MSEQQEFLNRSTDFYILHNEFGYMLWSELEELEKKLKGTRRHFSLTADALSGRIKEVTEEEVRLNEKRLKEDDDYDVYMDRNETIGINNNETTG